MLPDVLILPRSAGAGWGGPQHPASPAGAGSRLHLRGPLLKVEPISLGRFAGSGRLVRCSGQWHAVSPEHGVVCLWIGARRHGLPALRPASLPCPALPRLSQAPFPPRGVSRSVASRGACRDLRSPLVTVYVHREEAR